MSSAIRAHVAVEVHDDVSSGVSYGGAEDDDQLWTESSLSGTKCNNMW